MVTHLQAIEFIGGPFDGHKEIIALEPEALAGMLALPVNDNAFRLIEGSNASRKQPPTSVAVYHRTCEDGIWRYCFLGAASSNYAVEEHVWV